jgi:hypothetical protein
MNIYFVIFRMRDKYRKIFSIENIFKENDFSENIFRRKLFYVEVNRALLENKYIGNLKIKKAKHKIHIQNC